MDIHRCRFVPYQTSAINSVAFSHPSLPSNSKHSKTAPARLAIGRANGDIEIWNPMHGVWLHESTIAGGQDRSIEGLAWVVGDDEELDDDSRSIYSHGQLRLFSIGYTNAITEWDLENGCAKRHASGQHGDIWCLAVQPKTSASTKGVTVNTSQKLVAGTMDGCLALYSTDDGELSFQRLHRVYNKNVRMISIAFQSRHRVVVGCSDSTIRVMDIRNGSLVQAMTLGRDLSGTAKDILVWAVRCLPSGDIVSGDSTGQICIWDGKTYTQAQRIQAHTQDVLSLATSSDGSAIVSGGMDRRVVLYRAMAGRSSRWAKVWHRRYHQHDVKAMASFEAKGVSVVVAGGPDSKPVVIPLEKSGVQYHRTLSHLPQTVPLASAPRARLMIGWWEREVHIWRFEQSIEQFITQPDVEINIDRNRRLVGRIMIQGEANITTAAINSDGTLLVVATNAQTKAFQLEQVLPGPASNGLIISKIPVTPRIASIGASSLSISPDGAWVCHARGVENRVSLMRAVREVSGKLTFSPKVLRLARAQQSIHKYEKFGGLGQYNRRITQLSFSPDSRMLAAGDLAGYIDTWVLCGPDGTLPNGENTLQEEVSDHYSDSDSSSTSFDEDELSTTKNTQWIRNPRSGQLPKLTSAPVVLSFSPDIPGAPSMACRNETSSDYVLLVITADTKFYVFNPLRARLAHWSRRLAPSNLPVEFRNVRDLAKGVLWQGPRVWVYGVSFLFMVDTSVEVPMADLTSPTSTALVPLRIGQTQSISKKKKRKRGDDTGAGGTMAEGWIEPQNVQLGVAKNLDDIQEASGPKGKGNTQVTDKEGSIGTEWVSVGTLDTRDEKIGQDGRINQADNDNSDLDSDSDDSDDSRGHGHFYDESSSMELDVDPDAHREGTDQTQQQAQAGNGTTVQAKQKHLVQVNGSTPKQPPTRSWHTFKYRPILGVVPMVEYDRMLSGSEFESGETYQPLEVALVELPDWDIDVPPRYDENE